MQFWHGEKNIIYYKDDHGNIDLIKQKIHNSKSGFNSVDLIQLLKTILY